MNKHQFLQLIPMLLGLFCCDTQVETQPTPTPESRTGIEGSIVLHNIQAGPTREGVPDSKPLGKMTFGDFPRGGFFAWLLSYVFSFCAGCQVSSRDTGGRYCR